MAEKSKIEWCDHTFNPWIGCTKVSPGCANCYAETLMDKRYGRVQWGKGNPRSRTSEANWKQVERWNRNADEGICVDCGTPIRNYGISIDCQCGQAGAIGKMRRPRVFVASLADWLDPEVPIEWLADLLDLVRRCPHLDFLMLTKRPELWRERVGAAAGHWGYEGQVGSLSASGATDTWAFCFDWLHHRPPANIWIGTSVEDQQRADERIPALLRIPAKVRFLSCEPLLQRVDLFSPYTFHKPLVSAKQFGADIHWVIAGGESGPNARPMHPDWARSLRDQCQAAGVPFFFKQWGEWAPEYQAVELTEKAAASALYLDIYGKTDPAKIGSRRGRVTIQKLGKAKSGRLLDGREWNQFPEGGEG